MRVMLLAGLIAALAAAPVAAQDGASDEANNGAGRFDAWKLQRLLGVGADVAIPDYRDAEVLLPVLFGERARP